MIISLFYAWLRLFTAFISLFDVIDLRRHALRWWYFDIIISLSICDADYFYAIFIIDKIFDDDIFDYFMLIRLLLDDIDIAYFRLFRCLFSIFSMMPFFALLMMPFFFSLNMLPLFHYYYYRHFHYRCHIRYYYRFSSITIFAYFSFFDCLLAWYALFIDAWYYAIFSLFHFFTLIFDAAACCHYLMPCLLLMRRHLLILRYDAWWCAAARARSICAVAARDARYARYDYDADDAMLLMICFDFAFDWRFHSSDYAILPLMPIFSLIFFLFSMTPYWYAFSDDISIIIFPIFADYLPLIIIFRCFDYFISLLYDFLFDDVCRLPLFFFALFYCFDAYAFCWLFSRCLTLLESFIFADADDIAWYWCWLLFCRLYERLFSCFSMPFAFILMSFMRLSMMLEDYFILMPILFFFHDAPAAADAMSWCHDADACWSMIYFHYWWRLRHAIFAFIAFIFLHYFDHFSMIWCCYAIITLLLLFSLLLLLIIIFAALSFFIISYDAFHYAAALLPLFRYAIWWYAVAADILSFWLRLFAIYDLPLMPFTRCRLFSYFDMPRLFFLFFFFFYLLIRLFSSYYFRDAGLLMPIYARYRLFFSDIFHYLRCYLCHAGYHALLFRHILMPCWYLYAVTLIAYYIIFFWYDMPIFAATPFWWYFSFFFSLFFFFCYDIIISLFHDYFDDIFRDVIFALRLFFRRYYFYYDFHFYRHDITSFDYLIFLLLSPIFRFDTIDSYLLLFHYRYYCWFFFSCLLIIIFFIYAWCHYFSFLFAFFIIEQVFHYFSILSAHYFWYLLLQLLFSSLFFFRYYYYFRYDYYYIFSLLLFFSLWY